MYHNRSILNIAIQIYLKRNDTSEITEQYGGRRELCGQTELMNS